MRKIFVFAMYCFAMTVIACSDEDQVGGGDSQWFRQPEVTVDGTNVDVRCLALVGEGVLSAGRSGFVCLPSEGGSAVAVTVTDPVVEGTILRCRITGLTPRTHYMIYAYVELNGQRLIGQPAVFDTGEASVEPDDPENPDNPENPDKPDPDDPTPPRPGAYSGWPELPVKASGADLYYATHICPAFTTASGVFENNLRSYTVCYSNAMKCAMWVAYPIHASYKGSTKRTDKWAFDPIVPKSVQPYLVSGSYKPRELDYSRGHMLASNDRTGSVGMNEQTFYVTNMTPQKQTNFNSGIWSTLEDRTWNNVCADTLFVVTGAYFANTDVTCLDNASPQNTVYVPTNFYKVMIRSKAGNTGKPLYQLDADELQCVGFWLENRAYSGTTLTSVMTSVAEIETTTGMKFFEHVPQAPKAVLDKSAWKF